MARLATDASRPGPTWSVPQAHNLACYGWNGVPPTRDEMRSMAWQCIAGGANGLVFYSLFDLQRDPAATFTERWTDLKAVAQEIKNLEAMLLADPAPAGTVSGPINDEVGWRAYQLDGDICLVAVNATRTSTSASFVLNQALNPSVLLGRDVSCGSTASLTLDLQPLEVRVIRLSTNLPYSSWATTNAGGQAANLDYDNDGVSNGIEYFMGAAAGFTANSGLAGNTVTWPNGGNIPSSAYGTVFVVQTSTDLVNWTDVPGTDPNLVNTSGSVAYTVTGTGKKFVRLKVSPMN
jgi:hypothetical protein